MEVWSNSPIVGRYVLMTWNIHAPFVVIDEILVGWSTCREKGWRWAPCSLPHPHNTSLSLLIHNMYYFDQIVIVLFSVTIEIGSPPTIWLLKKVTYLLIRKILWSYIVFRVCIYFCIMLSLYTVNTTSSISLYGIIHFGPKSGFAPVAVYQKISPRVIALFEI